MMSYISTALAQDAAATASAAAPTWGSFVPLLLIIVVFYFLILRPQQKRYREHREMITALRRGDRVVTAGGVVGVVRKVDDGADMLDVEIADSVVVKVVRSTVSRLVSKPEPAAANDSDKPAENKPNGNRKNRKKS